MKQIHQLLFAAIIICCMVSCSKNAAEMAVPIIKMDSIASYKIIVTGTWRMPQHTIPANDHFTGFIGMVHNSKAQLFQLGKMATTGVEAVAEIGYTGNMENEINTYIMAGHALKAFQFYLPTVTATDSIVVNVSSEKSLISFASMIAPSPDWFVGLESFNLIKDGEWLTDVTVNAPGYDAGTEEGDVFGYGNPATVPQQNVSYLTPANASVIANGNPVIAPFATVRFIRQK